MGSGNLLTVLALMSGLVVVVVTLVNTNAAIAILIFSMLLSPELGVGGGTSRQVVIRIDDLLVLLITFTWLAKVALQQGFGIFRWTKLHVPLFLFTTWCIVATVLGIVSGAIGSPKASAFYLLKYVEYFFIFFLGVNVMREERQVRLFWRCLILTAVCVGVYGWWSRAHGEIRISAPFEGEPEPNTLAGYLLLIMGVLLGRAAYAQTTTRFLQLAGLVAFLFVPFLSTLSRGGYLAFLTMYVLLILVTPHRKLWFVIPLLLVAVVGPSIFPTEVIQRIQSTFVGKTVYGTHGEQLGLDPSAAQRIDIWWSTFDLLKKHPFVGYGVSGAGLMDQQYCLVLAELGLIGAAIYAWTRWAIFQLGWQAYRAVSQPEYRGLILGYLCAYVGLLVHSFAGNIFIIVRIMEPFWFLTAMMAVLPEVLPAPTAAAPRTTQPA